MSHPMLTEKPNGAVTVTHRTWTVALTGGFNPPIFRLHTDPGAARDTFEELRGQVRSPGESLVVIEQTVYSDGETSDIFTAEWSYADRLAQAASPGTDAPGQVNSQDSDPNPDTDTDTGA